MLDLCEQLSCTASTPVFLTCGFISNNYVACSLTKLTTVGGGGGLGGLKCVFRPVFQDLCSTDNKKLGLVGCGICEFCKMAKHKSGMTFLLSRSNFIEAFLRSPFLVKQLSHCHVSYFRWIGKQICIFYIVLSQIQEKHFTPLNFSRIIFYGT